VPKVTNEHLGHDILEERSIGECMYRRGDVKEVGEERTQSRDRVPPLTKLLTHA
jgi:hypothetical protein